MHEKRIWKQKLQTEQAKNFSRYMDGKAYNSNS